MQRHRLSRRRCLGLIVIGNPVLALAGAAPARVGEATAAAADNTMHTLHTFGDSVLDCGHYNEHGVHPGQLLVRNDDALFPEFRGRDLLSRSAGGTARLVHRAVDGATVQGLRPQARDIAGQARRGSSPAGRVLAIVSVGGNDLLRGLAADNSGAAGAGIRAFEAEYDAFLRALPIRPVLLANVYDPTFGDDSRNFLNVDARVARANHRRVNDVIAALARRHGGTLVDLHGHFLRGSPDWFTRVIEPSLIGASEVRRAFLAAL